MNITFFYLLYIQIGLQPQWVSPTITLAHVKLRCRDFGTDILTRFFIQLKNVKCMWYGKVCREGERGGEEVLVPELPMYFFSVLNGLDVEVYKLHNRNI